jgi:DUF1009 family protein
MKKVGLIAGMGELPIAVAIDARSKGYNVIAVGLEPLAVRPLDAYVDEIRWINVGKLGAIIEYLKKSGVEEVIMAGKVPKEMLYKSKISPDLRAIKLLFTLRDRSDDSIMLAIAKELKKDGITLLNTTDFSSRLLTPEGVLSDIGPTEEEWKDIAFGWGIAKEMGRLDIGQTVVIKNQAVMAIEAIEGTDEAIKRGGKLAGSGAVVVKVSKPQQDMRFDVPVAGLDTVRSMVEVKARVLAVEAEKSILLEKERLIKEANEAGIAVVGFKNNRTG